MSANPNIFYPGTDVRGSLRVACDAQGKPVAWFDYDAFGRDFGAGTSAGDAALTARLTRRYTGQRFEAENALYDYGARCYDSELARFVSPDPAHEAPSPYAYCANDPVDHIDPDGGVRVRIIYYRTWYLVLYNDRIALIWGKNAGLNDDDEDGIEAMRYEIGEKMPSWARALLDRVVDVYEGRYRLEMHKAVNDRRTAYRQAATKSQRQGSVYSTKRLESIEARPQPTAEEKKYFAEYRNAKSSAKLALRRTAAYGLFEPVRFYSEHQLELFSFVESKEGALLMTGNPDLRKWFDAVRVAYLYLIRQWEEQYWGGHFKLTTNDYMQTYLLFRDHADDAMGDTESLSSSESDDSSIESLDDHDLAKGGPRRRDEDDPGQGGGRRIAKDGPFKGQTAPSYYGDDDVL